MVLSTFADFGVQDARLYSEYLRACVAVGLATSESGFVRNGDGRSVGLASVDAYACLERVFGKGDAGVEFLRNSVLVDSTSGGGRSLGVGVDGVSGESACVGVSSVSLESSGEGVGAGSCGDRGAGLVGHSGVGVVSVDGSAESFVEDSCVSVDAVRGRHYKKNKKKKENRRMARAGFGGVCPSLTGSVRTVDTRTAFEMEAADSLARRRAAENEVAIALAKHKLASLQDKSKTESLSRLAAARIEERINTAKARSQASYKKCDESLKSLGSTGSAGEFALKKEVEKGAAWEVKYKYLEEQLKLAFPYIPDDVKQRICELPEPEFPNAHEIFGDCPSDYNDDEREAYYIELDRMNADAVCA